MNNFLKIERSKMKNAENKASSNRWQTITLICISAILLLVLTASSGTGGKPDNQDVDNSTPNDAINLIYAPGQVVVKFTPEANPFGFGAQVLDSALMNSSMYSGPYLLVYGPDEDLELISEQLNESDDVVYAHPNYIMNKLHPVQGSYPFEDDIGTGEYQNQNAANDLSISDAQSWSTGNGITVGIIDGGTDYNHPILAGKNISGYDFVDEDLDPFDVTGGNASGHGTFVAGIINLVAPDANIRVYRVINQFGEGDGFTLAKAIERAVNEGCDVINISLTLTGRHLAVKEAIEYANSQGCLVVAAAGNNSSSMAIYPAAETSAIAVAAVDSNRLLSDFSNYGSHIDICAPGSNIYSSYLNSNNAWWSGTSFSTPFVAGQIALIYQLIPDFDVDIIRNVLTTTAISLDPINPDYIGLLGNGMIDPVTAVSTANDLHIASVMPDTLFFTHEEGTMYFTAPWQTTFLTSSNAPALYSAFVFEPGPLAAFAFIQDSAGYTNDTLEVYISPELMPVGTHYNSVLINVEGVTDPVELVVCLTVTPFSGDHTATISPNLLHFESSIHSDQIMWDTAFLSSTNAPASYSGLVSFGNGFTNILNPTGMTNEVIEFSVNPSLIDTPGLYYDTVAFIVDGVTDPAFLTVELLLTDDTVFVYTVIPEVHWFYANYGESFNDIGTFMVQSVGAQAGYVVDVIGDQNIIQWYDSVGVTGDSIGFGVGSTSEMPAGIYADTMVIYVDEDFDNPLFKYVYLEISPDSLDDNAWTAPDNETFYAVYPSTTIQSSSFDIYSSNAPALYFAEVNGGAGSFVSVTDSVGYTDATIYYDVDPTGLDLGQYRDTITIFVEGVSSLAYIEIILNIMEDADSTRSSLELKNFPNPFNPTTEIQFNLENSTQARLTIYNLLGREITTLINKQLPAGDHSVLWNGTDENGQKVASGIYFYKLTTEYMVETKRMLLLK
jgi:thermitase